MGLLEILAIIDQPKKIVYGYGKAIGGEGVGIWAADNSQMFFPDSIGAETLVSALLTIQDVISRSCRIEIGIGAHHGNFYSLCGGLYGTEAEAIEEIVENHAGGGEVLISHAIYMIAFPAITPLQLRESAGSILESVLSIGCWMAGGCPGSIRSTSGIPFPIPRISTPI